MKCAVCDTGPLTHIWQIDLWGAFSAFHIVHISEHVYRELEQHVELELFEQRAKCHLEMHCVSSAEIESCRNLASASRRLHLADLSVLALSQKVEPDVVLTDDLSFRRVLEVLGYQVMGSVGLLLYAYKVELLSQEGLESAVDSLFTGSTLYLSQQFKAGTGSVTLNGGFSLLQAINQFEEGTIPPQRSHAQAHQVSQLALLSW